MRDDRPDFRVPSTRFVGHEGVPFHRLEAAARACRAEGLLPS